MEQYGLNHLVVIHRPKDAAGHGMDDQRRQNLSRHGMFLDTCLRQVAIIDANRTPGHLAAQTCSGDPTMELRRGAEAYSFLLQTATGLNSSIPGETNILGQFKHAWRHWRAQAEQAQLCGIQTTMHSLIADSSRIRQEYLQGIGGNSYGTLVRKLLQPETDTRLLFVGTGKLAQSMLPFFAAFERGLWSRGKPREAQLESVRVFGRDGAQHAADWATHLLLTTPAEDGNDGLWAKLIDTNIRKIVHLGRRRAEPGVWSDSKFAGQYFDLDDVFDLRQQQSSLRSLQICRARKACQQLAGSYAMLIPDATPQSLLA